MLNILLVVHVVIAILLVTVILLQKNSADALAGLSSGNNMGIVSAKGAANFMTKTTVFLAIAFMSNSLILANLSNKNSKIQDNKGSLTEKLEQKEQSSNTLPIAQ